MANEQAYNQKGARAIIISVDFFARTSAAFKTVAEDLSLQNKRLKKIESKISDILKVDAYALEPVPVEVVERAPLSSITKQMKDRSFDLLKLGLILPFLLDKRARDYIADFATGLVGLENLEMFRSALKAVALTIGAVLGYKFLKQVGDAVSTILRLAQLTAALFLLTSEESVNIESKKNDLEDRKRRDKAKRDKMRENRVKRAKKIRDLKGLFTKIKFGGPLGFAVGAVMGAGIGTMIDVVLEADQKQFEAEERAIENDEEIPEANYNIDFNVIAESFKRNFLENITFGLLSRSPEELLGTTKEARERNIKEIEGLSVGSMGEISSMEPNQYEEPQNTKPIKRESSTFTPIEPMFKSKKSHSTEVSSPLPQTGEAINSASETVNNNKKLNSSKHNIVVNNIDKSTFVSVNQADKFINNDALPSYSLGISP